MKAFIAVLLLGGVCVAATTLIVTNRQREQHQAELARAQAVWAKEKAEFEASLKRASRRTVAVEPSVSPAPAPTVIAATEKPDPQVIIERLKRLKIAAPTPTQPTMGNRNLKRLIHEFEALTDAGEAALPAIRAFLDQNEDLDYQVGSLKLPRDGTVPTDFFLPPSLRLGLLEVVRQIGGAQAETLLDKVMGTTARGLELGYLARVLHELAPNKYRDQAVAAAQELLANPIAEAAALDKNDRQYLFGVLAFFKDASYVASAQGQLLVGNGQVDRAALKYLYDTMGEQSVPLVAQVYQDARTDAASKEPLARVALAFVGANPQAEQLFHQAVRDAALKPDAIRNLVEDLNQDGLSNKKTPSPADLRLIANRFALTQRYLQQDFVQGNKVLLGAFREADKDLRNLLQQAAAPAKAPQ